MKSILLVDDDEHFQYSIKRVCKKVPEICELFVASNGQEALSFLRERISESKKIPDFLLLDINMPVMNGFEFLECYGALRSEFPALKDLPILAMLTSSAHEKDKERAMATGLVKDYVIKPGDSKEAVSIIQKLIA